jgi:NAD-dependent DNA ligase
MAEDRLRAHADALFRDHVVVFTGKLACLTRQAAQARVRELGGEIARRADPADDDARGRGRRVPEQE